MTEPSLSTSCVSSIDRVDLDAYHHKLKQEANKGYNSARIYRNAYEKIKQRYKELDIKSCKDKDAIRFFWRNQIMEGQFRAGNILRRAIMSPDFV